MSGRHGDRCGKIIYTARVTSRSQILRCLRIPLIAGALLLFALPASGQDVRRYQVEIVVFRHTEPATSGELWQRPAGLVAMDEAALADTAFAAPAADDASRDGEQFDPDEPLNAETVPVGSFELLAAADYKLSDAVARLSKARRFSPLLHTGWVQPGLPLEESGAKNVSGRDREATVSGRVVVSLESYLHLDVDLTLEAADGDYRLRQSLRRIQTGRFYYIDHPLFSVISVVSRAPVEAVEATP